MTTAPLMPKATAVWLVDNTSLTFDQIAEFCNLHVLEVKGIADGDVAHGIKGMDPITSGQLTRDEIKRGQENSDYRLKISGPKVEIPEVKTKKGPRYTPVSRRQDRPNAILWLLRHHPELKDSQIMRLVGTTKPTILAIRERTHWNSANLQPMDPVTLGLCSQTELDKDVQKAARRVAREEKALRKQAEKAGTLLPSEETTQAPETGAADVVAEIVEGPEAGVAEMGDGDGAPVIDEVAASAAADVQDDKDLQDSLASQEEISAADVFPDAPPAEKADEPEEEEDADSVFAKLKELKVDNDDD